MSFYMYVYREGETCALQVSVAQLVKLREALGQADHACVTAVRVAADAAQKMRTSHDVMLAADKAIAQMIQFQQTGGSEVFYESYLLSFVIDSYESNSPTFGPVQCRLSSVSL